MNPQRGGFINSHKSRARVIQRFGIRSNNCFNLKFIFMNFLLFVSTKIFNQQNRKNIIWNMCDSIQWIEQLKNDVLFSKNGYRMLCMVNCWHTLNACWAPNSSLWMVLIRNLFAMVISQRVRGSEFSLLLCSSRKTLHHKH